MNTALTQAVAKGYDGTFWPAFRAKITWGSIGFLCSGVVSVYYLVKGNAFLAAIFFLLALFTPFFDALTIYGPLLAGKKNFKESSIYNTAAQIFLSGSTVIAAILTGDAIIMIGVYLLSGTLARGMVLLKTTKKFLSNTSVSTQDLSFGKKLSALNILGIPAMYLDSILLWHFLGPQALAIYSFSSATIAPVKTFFKSVVNLAYPKFTVKTSDTLKNTLLMKITKGMLLIFPFLIAYILIIPAAYHIFFPQYLESIIYAQVIALSLLFFPGKLLGIAITTRERKRDTYLLSALNSGIKILLLLLFLPPFGIWGAIAALFASQAMSGILSWYFFRRMR